MENGKKPIAPIYGANNVPFSDKESIDWIESCALLTGLTKREYFSSMAMQGILANELLMASYKAGGANEKTIGEKIAKDAIEAADNLLNLLEK